MATIHDIAAATGLPAPTVARILRGGNKEVWPSAIARATHVREVAARLGYRPNAAARAVSTGRFNAVGLLHGYHVGQRYSPPDLLGGIYAALERHNLHLTSARLPDDKLTGTGFVPRILKELAADGLLVDHLGDPPPPALQAIVGEGQVPVLFLNANRLQDAVCPDDVHAGRLAAEYLLTLGHRRIAFVAFTPGTHFSRPRRWEGVQTTAAEAGVEAIDGMRPAPGPAGLERAHEIIRTAGLAGGPTAVVCYSNQEAEQLIYAAAVQGRRIPQDLSLVSISEDVLTKFGPTVTTARLPFRQIGELAVETLLEKIAGTAGSLPTQFVPATLSPGGTTAAPPSPGKKRAPGRSVGRSRTRPGASGTT